MRVLSLSGRCVHKVVARRSGPGEGQAEREGGPTASLLLVNLRQEHIPDPSGLPIWTETRCSSLSCFLNLQRQSTRENREDWDK